MLYELVRPNLTTPTCIHRVQPGDKMNFRLFYQLPAIEKLAVDEPAADGRRSVGIAVVKEYTAADSCSAARTRIAADVHVVVVAVVAADGKPADTRGHRRAGNADDGTDVAVYGWMARTAQDN